MKRQLPLVLIVLIAGCMGTRPARYGESKLGFAAVLVRGKFTTPQGETRSGQVALNLEAEEGERYRLVFGGGETTLLRIEPDTYRLSPARNLFGFVKDSLDVEFGKRVYRVPFPRSILRKETFPCHPRKIVAIGVLEAKLLPVQQGREQKLVVRLDDSITTRRTLVENMIEKMMNPKTPVTIRYSAISWTRALEQALVQLQGEEKRIPAYKKASP